MIPAIAKRLDNATINKARKRIRKVPQADAILWADNAGSTIARSLSDFQSTGDIAHLTDAEHGALMLVGCLQALRERAEA